MENIFSCILGHMKTKEIDPIQFLLADARHLQILFLSAFLYYGIRYIGWDADWQKFITIFSTALFSQLLFCKIFNKDYSALKSALITSLGLCLLLKANHLYTYAFASFVAIASKFIFQIQKKHFYNPANIGIVAAIVLTGDAWISPGQWGSTAILIFLVGSLGVAVVTKVEKFDTTLGFMLVFFGLEFYRNVVYKGWPFDFFLHQISNGSILLFSFFMITDPVSTPNSKLARFIWAACIALLAFYLANFHFVNAAPVWALFFVSPLTILFDKLFKENRFNWRSKNQLQPISNTLPTI